LARRLRSARSPPKSLAAISRTDQKNLSPGFLLPHMQGSDVFNEEADVGIVEIHPGRITARSTRFTAHLNANGEGQRLAFYDNEIDPYQMSNLAGTDAFSEEQDRLFALLQTHHHDTPILPQPDYGFRQRN
jgi:hypothetical protein